MTIEEQLWAKAKIAESEFEKITDALLAINEKNGERTRYHDFEKAIRDFGYSESTAKVIIGLCAAKGMFLETVESWENIPIELKDILRDCEKEDNK